MIAKLICSLSDTNMNYQNVCDIITPSRLDAVQHRILSYAALRPPQKGTGQHKNTTERQIQSYTYATEKPAHGSTTL